MGVLSFVATKNAPRQNWGRSTRSVGCAFSGARWLGPTAPRQGLQQLLEHPLVGDARQRGLLGALELVADKKTRRPFDPALRLSERISRIAYRNGLIFRAFTDNILGFAPALCYSAAEMDLLFERLQRTLDDVLAERDVRAALT